MSRLFPSTRLVLIAAALCTTAQLNPEQGTSPSADTTASYFPKGIADPFANFFSGYLTFSGEPSLLAASREANKVSYRLDCLWCRRNNLVIIRFSVNAAGTAAIDTTIMATDKSPVVVLRTQRIVSSADSYRFLQLVEQSQFWSMQTEEQESPKVVRTDLAASHWVFEGARPGTYHAVFRLGPQPSPFTDMVLFLARDLAKLDKSDLPYTPTGRVDLPTDR